MIYTTAAGSAIGKEHIALGKNNQDAYYIRTSPAGIIAVICDGCSQGESSEVGAKIFSRAFANYLNNFINEPASSSIFANLDNLTRQVHRFFISNLSLCQTIIGMDHSMVVKDFLQFTTIAAIVTPSQTIVFSIGDGVVSVNKDIISIDPYLGNGRNEPPYVGYLITDSTIPLKELSPKVHYILPTDVIESVIIATDGAKDIIKNAATVGPLHQFLDNKYFSNPYNLTRRLNVMNMSHQFPDWEQRVIKKTSGVLEDDTTIVVIRANPS